MTYELSSWAPSWPRRVTRMQAWANNEDEAIRHLEDAERNGESPFISVYSFPRGHTKEGNIPRIDTLFIDFDFEGGDYERGSGDVDAWRRDISHLLVRVRRVAEVIHKNGGESWRAALSGHKGVHLFVDFDPLDPELGSLKRYVLGMNNYADALVDMIAKETGISDLDTYVDVTSSDMGRLCRVPGTIHEGATASFGENRYCVAISIEDLATLDADEYINRTVNNISETFNRCPSAKATDIIERHVVRANVHNQRTSFSTTDWSLVSAYREQSNDRITLGDIKFLTADRPCVWKFYERDDKYQHGYESHYMELFCIQELLEKNVPIDVIKQFLDSAPEYNETYSENRIAEIIARDYNRFNIESILQNAPTFCGYDDCSVCQRVLAATRTTT